MVHITFIQRNNRVLEISSNADEENIHNVFAFLECNPDVVNYKVIINGVALNNSALKYYYRGYMHEDGGGKAIGYYSKFPSLKALDKQK